MSWAVIAVVSDTPPIPLAAAGDVASYFRAHYARLVRSLAVVCGDGELAADAVQEAFVRAHARWHTIGHYDDPIGWIRRVALNLLRDDHRRTTRRRRAVARLAAEPVVVDEIPEADELGALLAGLPRQQRIAVALYYVEGLSVAEAAAAMDLTEGTVKSHLHDARRRLRRVLEEER